MNYLCNSFYASYRMLDRQPDITDSSVILSTSVSTKENYFYRLVTVRGNRKSCKNKNKQKKSATDNFHLIQEQIGATDKHKPGLVSDYSLRTVDGILRPVA